MRLSVVIPAFNEEGNIGRLVEETFDAVPDRVLGEVIVVDDGSGDGTGLEIKSLTRKYKALRYIRHATRAGQSAALRTGALAARFPAIATMDGDGQNDPNDIMRLYSQLAPAGEPPALVGGLRSAREGKGSRKLASRLANWIRDTILDDGCPDTGCGLKVYHRDAYTALPYFDGMHRYLPALFMSYGHVVVYEPVSDRPRLRGTSKYTNLGRAVIGLYDLIGVRWLRKRTNIPAIAEEISGAAEEAPRAGTRAGQPNQGTRLERVAR